MPEIRGTLNLRHDYGPCVWCGRHSNSLCYAPGIEREVSLHVLCAGRIILAYRRFQRGQVLETDTRERLDRVLRLPAGVDHG